MSAFIVSKKHIASIVGFYQGSYYDTNFNGNDGVKMANRLMRKNVESVQFRYRNEPIKDLPGVIDELSDNQIPEITLKDIAWLKPLKPVECLKAVNCLCYQSCELPDLYETEEYKFLQKVKAVAVNRLPGYEEAAWHIS